MESRLTRSCIVLYPAPGDLVTRIIAIGPQSDFSDSIGRMQFDHKPTMRRKRLDLSMLPTSPVLGSFRADEIGVLKICVLKKEELAFFGNHPRNTKPKISNKVPVRRESRNPLGLSTTAAKNGNPREF
jgi:hypothetical protein